MKSRWSLGSWSFWESGVGSRESGVGSRESGVGSRESGVGKRRPKNLKFSATIAAAVLTLSVSSVFGQQTKTLIDNFESGSVRARTGEPWYGFIVAEGSATASISNDVDNVTLPNTEIYSVVNPLGYAELVGVNLYLPSWVGNWSQASIGLDTKNNGTQYDLSQCNGGFSYRYQGNAHRVTLQSFHEGLAVQYVYDPPASSVWTEISLSPSQFERDEYDLAYENGYINVPLDLSKIEGIQWAVRPYALGTITNGSLRIDDCYCLGDLDLSGVDSNAVRFNPVTDITDLPSQAAVGTPLKLTGRVLPFNATNLKVTWSIAADLTTATAVISGDTLFVTKGGTVRVIATVENGATDSTDFTKVFDITVPHATLIDDFADGNHRAKTGEFWYGFLVSDGNSTASIYNELDPLNNTYFVVNPAAGYAELTGINLNLPTWNDWAQASIGLDAKNNGTQYDLSQCDRGFSYRYQGSAHRFLVNSFYEGNQYSYIYDVPASSSWTVVTLPINSLKRDMHDLAYEKGFTNLPLELNKVESFYWTVQPFNANTLGNPMPVSNGSLRVDDCYCLGDLNLSGVDTNVVAFTPVINITDVPVEAAVGTPLKLTGTVLPFNATNQKITWSIVADSTTAHAVISGDTLLASGSGKVRVRATVENGASATTDYAKSFDITVPAPPAATLISDFTGGALRAKTGEPWYGLVVAEGNSTASISNQINNDLYPGAEVYSVVNPLGYAELTNVNLSFPTWNDWAQATIQLDAKNNGTQYDLTECDRGFRYRYQGNAHKFTLQSFNDDGLEIVFYTNVSASSVMTEFTVSPNLLVRDTFDLAWKAGYKSRTLDLSKVEAFQWTIRPFTSNMQGNPVSVANGSLRVDDCYCLGELNLDNVDSNVVRFIGIQDITDVPAVATVGAPLKLTNKFLPYNATLYEVIWSIVDGSATTAAAVISNDTLLASSSGNVRVRATVKNGAVDSTDFTKDFDIEVPPASLLDNFNDGNKRARTGEFWHGVLVQSGNSTASIGNDVYDDLPEGHFAYGIEGTYSVVNPAGYAELKNVNMSIPTWNDWAHAVIELPAINNGTQYDLSKCENGFSYRYQGDTHLFRLRSFNAQGYEVVHHVNVPSSSDWREITISPNLLERDIYDNASTEVGYTNATLDLTKVDALQWMIRPVANSNNIPIPVVNGNLRIDDCYCLGDLDLKNVDTNVVRFVPVLDIVKVPTEGAIGVPLHLAGWILPHNAAKGVISSWNIVNDQTTATATLRGDTLVATKGGYVNVRATIDRGVITAGDTVDFVKDFMIYIPPQLSVISDDRVIPVNPGVNAPIVSALEFAAGPSPALKSAGDVKFFVSGSQSVSGTLAIHDAAGNMIRKVKLTDKKAVANARRRVVGAWNLRDARGRSVSEGTYLVRGVIKTSDGKSEKVSVVIGVGK